MTIDTYKLLLPAVVAALLLLAMHAFVLGRGASKRKTAEEKLRGQNLELTGLYQQLEAAEAELRINYNEITEMVYRDLATNLPNRICLEKVFAEGTWKDVSALLLVDIDKFKNINDAYGPSFGDQVLITVSEKLKEIAAEKGMILARLESDEFAVMPAAPIDRERAEELTVRIIEAFYEPLLVNGCLLRISLSCGIAVAGDMLDLDKLLRNAHLALNKAKKLGRGKYLVFEEAMLTEMSRRLTIEGKLQLALERHEFCLHYQPQYDIRSKQICGLEALVRWNDPERGLRYPNDFIQIAEETGQILFIGEAVLREACAFETLIVKEFGKIMPLSVNISCHQLGQQDFVEFVSNVTSEFGMKPEYLSFEITESTLIESFDDSIDKINKLKEKGINIHLDDFGTGYSSLNYLRNLPIDVVKIDKDFICDLGDPQANALIEFVITLAHKLGKGIIAEGVESEEQWARLTAYGCDAAQGYLMGRPASPETIMSLLREEFTGTR